VIERIIARLDVKGPNVIKGVHLEGLKVVGKPRDLARRYYDEGADEIVMMDVVASLYGRNNLLDIVEEVARETFAPVTVGGGVRTIDNIVALLRAGADKVAINTGAVRNPGFLNEAAAVFGSQCIVLSVEAKRRGPGTWEALTDNGRETSERDAIRWIEEAVERGAGEILLTSVDQEGTQKGFDLELMEAVYTKVQVPVIACGGAGKPGDVVELLSPRRCDAVACASLFHYGLCGIQELKNAISATGLLVRQ
jgi:imidazole glycerol-phosphate synthase subunit HisF